MTLDRRERLEGRGDAMTAPSEEVGEWGRRLDHRNHTYRGELK